MRSGIYEGNLSHARQQPARHKFSQRLFMMYLDLDELPTLFSKRWLWSASGPNVARFRREDHMGDPRKPLKEAVEELILQETGKTVRGRIGLLTHLGYFGFRFNPISFYYCFADCGDLQFIVAEVNNTPWGEQCCYLLDLDQADGGKGYWRWQSEKKMHVSPFMPMGVVYKWQLSAPAKNLRVQITNEIDGHAVFSAGMNLVRKPITGLQLARILLRYPLMTMQVMFMIHWHALRLWLKRVPVVTHPRKMAQRGGKV
ncbi:DUF1365 domain-containing protein [Biformimicrobium ophioploci]|uniref:DUF1365 domain-containing protein n=1 Tax=Biformimicrobium ophioploci TaxID=3036711 RepID=A0ABQ6LYT1_9GAMM|nr:DUF1365 domain-containing protein [Microbulbifer sp. NKW57]GMG87249.1 DUF1365 domain-containing protein [Microbulbifer sp. NKW57]